MELHLVDFDPALVNAWRQAFAPFREVTVECGDLLSVARNTVISAANGYGFMDGGIDAAYTQFFGPGIEVAVRNAIDRRPEGYLPVGASIVVATRHPRIPYLLVAPTMLMPEAVPAQNCYRAMRAILRVAGRDPEVGRAIYCPGLGTGVGLVPPVEAAKQMASAFADWQRDTGPASGTSP
jgi:O-acetyl-ADP-ribose deacetylase (regulator of RNase III)